MELIRGHFTAKEIAQVTEYLRAHGSQATLKAMIEAQWHPSFAKAVLKRAARNLTGKHMPDIAS